MTHGTFAVLNLALTCSDQHRLPQQADRQLVNQAISLEISNQVYTFMLILRMRLAINNTTAYNDYATS